MGFILPLAMLAAQGTANYFGQKAGNELQLEQQGKLNKQQREEQEKLNKYNQGLALDTWEKTGYGAQRKQIEDAGLNVGLMYGSAGGGGTTQGGQGGSVSGGTANAENLAKGMDIKSAIEASLMQSQKKNIDADTRNKEIDANKKEGVDTEKTGAETANIKTETRNKEIENEIKQYERDIAKIKADTEDLTKEEQRAQITKLNDKLTAEARKLVVEADVAEATKGTQIESAKLAVQAQKLGLTKTNADTKAVEAGIRKTASDILNTMRNNEREWQKLTIQERELMVKEALQRNNDTMTEFNTSTPEQIKQWTGIIGSVIGATPTPTPRKIGFK